MKSRKSESVNNYVIQIGPRYPRGSSYHRFTGHAPLSMSAESKEAGGPDEVDALGTLGALGAPPAPNRLSALARSTSMLLNLGRKAGA